MFMERKSGLTRLGPGVHGPSTWCGMVFDDANASINSDWDPVLYFYPSDKVVSRKIIHNAVNAGFVFNFFSFTSFCTVVGLISIWATQELDLIILVGLFQLRTL